MIDSEVTDTISITIEDLTGDVHGVIAHVVGASVEEAAKLALKEISARCPSKRVRKSLYVTKPKEIESGVFECEVGSPLKLAVWLEYGTDPHRIKAKNKKALWWEGADHPVKEVQHPGTSARPFFRTALQAMVPRVVEAMAGWVAKLERMGR